MFVLERETMTTYPDFIDKERDKSLRKRAELRWKFFEEEGYRKLSDVFGLTMVGKDNYIKKRDEYMLAYYIQNVNPEHGSVNGENLEYYVSQLLDQDITKTDININAIYNYLDERRKYGDWLSSEEKFCTHVFSKFENQLRNRDTFCLY